MNRFLMFVCACVLLVAAAQPALAAPDIVLRASDVRTVRGNWNVVSDGSAAGGQAVSSTDYGWSVTGAPLAQPNDYFEMSFSAPANTPYHVWVRLRASGGSKYNDSVWVQYSDALTSGGAPVYAIGSASGLNLNLERCSGCGVSGWGWQDGAYWLSQATTVKFASTGTHTIRVQIREDGAQIDQIVLSPAAYLFASPGGMTNDSTIVPLSGGVTTPSAGPYLGSPVALPGRVEAENFDNGPEGTSYDDTTAGNAGGAYRQTNVDIEGCSEGGHNVGWVAPGEWMNYSVRTSSGGSYTVKLRVASPGGGWLHVGFNGPSNVWQSVQVPASGGWQNWTTVSLSVTLGAGAQLMTLMADTAGFNLNYIEVTAGSTTTTTAPTAAASSSSSGGASVPVVTWNVQISSSESHARQAMANLMTLNPRPQIIVLEEAYGPLYNAYISELQTRSGQTWSGVFRSHCPSGAWNGSSCTSSEDEGVAVLTSLPVINTGGTLLPYADSWHSARAVARAAVNVGGVTVQVFAVHLQPGNASARYSSMSVLKSYAGSYSAPQLVAGDFNADMDQIDTTSGMYPNFVDTWKQVGSGTGATAFSGSPTMKLDYWFADAGGRARPEWSVVLTNFGTFSDHFPVMTSFAVR